MLIDDRPVHFLLVVPHRSYVQLTLRYSDRGVHHLLSLTLLDEKVEEAQSDICQSNDFAMRAHVTGNDRK